MRNLKYFLILLLITSCSMPSKEDLYRESLDRTINKDLEGYGIMVVRFEKIIYNRNGKIYTTDFGNVEVCKVEYDERCINLSMYRRYAGLFMSDLRISISGKYFSFKLKPGTYYIRHIQTGMNYTNDRDYHLTNFDNSNYTFNIKRNKIIYIGDLSFKYEANGNPFNLDIKHRFIIKNNFKEAISEIKKQNPLLDVSNAEVDLLKMNE